MVCNRFFGPLVRIQSDRGHTVVDSGPYRSVRHPGYTGAVLSQLTFPLVLGSSWALIPFGLSALFFILRTGLEDRTLRKELDGYEAYTRRVRFRLIPGIW